MNFRGPRDFSHDSDQFQKVVAYLLEIQVHYLELYNLLATGLQFDYEVEACRRHKRFARIYLSNLVSTVKIYQHEKKLTEENFFWRYEFRGQLSSRIGVDI